MKAKPQNRMESGKTSWNTSFDFRWSNLKTRRKMKAGSKCIYFLSTSKTTTSAAATTTATASASATTGATSIEASPTRTAKTRRKRSAFAASSKKPPKI